MKRRLSILVAIVLTYSQFAFAQPSASQLIDNDHAAIPARGGSIDWGLAISGGGERAASFSIGVMKALYDKGLLDQIDVISSVSGGGYANYWLLTNYYQNRTLRFGEGAFSNSAFLMNVCQLQMTSDFIPARAVIRVFSHKKHAFEYYEGRIQRSFGNPRPSPKDAKDTHDSLNRLLLRLLPINFVNDKIPSGDAPLFILNGALKAKIDSPDIHKRLIEMTGLNVGSRDLHFAKWDDTTFKAWDLLEGIAISGAALTKLSTKKPAPRELALNGQKFELIDGGLVENLGALPLIRRGLNKVIIVDSSSDGDYNFGNYSNLKALLSELKIDFSVPAIESFLGQNHGAYTGPAVTVGSATSAKSADDIPIDTKVYYIKLSLPSSVVQDDKTRF